MATMKPGLLPLFIATQGASARADVALVLLLGFSVAALSLGSRCCPCSGIRRSLSPVLR